jgi:hypothetical protein
MLPSIRAWLPWVRRRPKYSKQEVLRALPVRNALVEWALNDDQEVVLKIPRRKDRVGRILSRIFAAPEFKQIVLDEVGSDVWQLCTGENTVDAIVRDLARKYKLNRREVELSLSNYLKQLAQRGLIGLRIAPSGPEPTRVVTGKKAALTAKTR